MSAVLVFDTYFERVAREGRVRSTDGMIRSLITAGVIGAISGSILGIGAYLYNNPI